MNYNVLQTITDQVEKLNLPQDQADKVLSEVQSKFGGQNIQDLSQGMIEKGLDGILRDNGIQSDLVGTFMNNFKDGFQLSDITLPLKQASGKGFMDNLKSMFGDFFGGKK